MLFRFNVKDGYKKLDGETLKDRITSLQSLTLENGDKIIICCQYTGHVQTLQVTGLKPLGKVSVEHHNTLSNIFRIEPIPTDKPNSVKFALATNNGVIILQLDTSK